MPKAPKSFQEFSLECKSEQRRFIREERARMEQAREILDEAGRKFEELGLHLMTPQDVSDRFHDLDKMLSEVDEKYGDTELMQMSYSAYLRSNTAE